jgi:hypothetical protein
VEDAGVWIGRLRRGDEVTQTVLRWVWDGNHVAQVLLVLGLVAAACILAFFVTPRPRVTARGVLFAAAALSGWRIAYVATPILLEVDRAERGWTGLAAAVGVAIAIPTALVLLARGSRLALLPALALAPLLWPDFTAHTEFALVTVFVVLVGLAAVVTVRRLGTATAA